MGVYGWIRHDRTGETTVTETFKFRIVYNGAMWMHQTAMSGCEISAQHTVRMHSLRRHFERAIIQWPISWCAVSELSYNRLRGKILYRIGRMVSDFLQFIVQTNGAHFNFNRHRTLSLLYGKCNSFPTSMTEQNLIWLLLQLLSPECQLTKEMCAMISTLNADLTIIWFRAFFY